MAAQMVVPCAQRPPRYPVEDFLACLRDWEEWIQHSDPEDRTEAKRDLLAATTKFHDIHKSSPDRIKAIIDIYFPTRVKSANKK
jgi:hypothetical protein